MTRTSLDHHNCSFARTVDIIGDRWSLMIVRDAFYGVRRFSEFKERLGVTQAVLSSRLGRLVEHGLLIKEPPGIGGRGEYRLTGKGRALFPAMVALMQWGDRFIHDDVGAPIVINDHRTGQSVDPLRVTSGGEPVSLPDLAFTLGPGASESTRDAFGRLQNQKIVDPRGS